MVKFIVSRLLYSLPILFGIVFFVVIAVDLIPGDPVEVILGADWNPASARALRAELGLDRPLLVRYISYVGKVAQGDFGRSFRDRTPVALEIMRVWPNTLLLTAASLSIAVVLGVLAGVLSAVKRNTWIDGFVRVISLLGLSMPIFWTGLIAIWIFAFYFRWFPVGGIGTWQHLVLPAVTLAAPSVAMVARMTRSSMLEVFGEDYLATARAKGLSERVVVFKHALKNAFMPVVTLIGLQVGNLMGGSVLTETVFSWPGLGQLMVRAIFTRDVPVLQGGVLVMATTFVLVNLTVDLVYVFLDPRVRYS